MEDQQLKEYKEIFDLYQKSRMIAYGSPDQFQYRQNELLQKLAEFILIPFWQWEHEEHKKKENIDSK